MLDERAMQRIDVCRRGQPQRDLRVRRVLSRAWRHLGIEEREPGVAQLESVEPRLVIGTRPEHRLVQGNRLVDVLEVEAGVGDAEDGRVHRRRVIGHVQAPLRPHAAFDVHGTRSQSIAPQPANL